MLPAGRGASKHDETVRVAFRQAEGRIPVKKTPAPPRVCRNYRGERTVPLERCRVIARRESSPILHLIRRFVDDERVRQLSDQVLLEQFREQRDEAAFGT